MGPEMPAPALTAHRTLPQLLFTRETVRWAVTCLVAPFPHFFSIFFSLSSRDLENARRALEMLSASA